MKNSVKSKILILVTLLLGCVIVTGAAASDTYICPDNVKINGNNITISNKTSEISLTAGQEFLYINSLNSTGQTSDVLPSAFSFPYGLTDDILEWTLLNYKPISKIESGLLISGVRFTYLCEQYDLELNLEILTFPEQSGPFEFISYLSNDSNNTVTIEPENFASISFGNGGNFISISKESGIAEGYNTTPTTIQTNNGIHIVENKPLATVQAACTVNQDWNVNGYFPMVFLDKGDHGYYCAINWTQGCVEAKNRRNIATMSASMDYKNDPYYKNKLFSTCIKPNSSFSFPSVYIGAYNGDLDDAGNEFKNWFFRFKSSKSFRDNPQEPLTQMDMQAGTLTYGIDSLKWDYGWWTDESGKNGEWGTLEGSWEIRSKAYIDSLNSMGFSSMCDFGTYLESENTSWCVYALLHDTVDAMGNPTDSFGEFNSLSHSDWFSNRKVSSAMGASADLGNTDCVSYLSSSLADFFIKNKITTWRSDFEPICYYSDKENRHQSNGTDTTYWCTVGFSELLNDLRTNVPGFRYECCSSGGSLKNLYIASLADVINCDDSANYLSLRMSFYDSSYIIPPAQLQLPCNIDTFNINKEAFCPKVKTTGLNDESYDFEKAMLDMGFRTLMLGAPMFSSGTVSVLPEYYEKYSSLYQDKIRPLVRDGNLYHILPRPNGVDYDGVMYSNPNSKSDIKAAVFIFKPSESPKDPCHIILRGLDENTVYSLEFEDSPENNVVISGKDLMTVGIDVNILYVGSEIIWIKEQKENTVYGDLNGDGKVNAVDLSLLNLCIVGKLNIVDYPEADINKDGKVNALDTFLITQIIVGA